MYKIRLLSQTVAYDNDRIRGEFASLSDGDSSGLGQSQWAELMQKMGFQWPQKDDDELLERCVFAAFDRKRNGRVQWSEMREVFDVLASNDKRAKLKLFYRSWCAASSIDVESQANADSGVSMQGCKRLLQALCEFVYARQGLKNPFRLVFRFVVNKFEEAGGDDARLTLRLFAELSESSNEMLSLLSLVSIMPFDKNMQSPRVKRPATTSKADAAAASSSSDQNDNDDDDNDDGDASPELSEFEARLVRQVRALQAELKRRMDADEASEPRAAALERELAEQVRLREQAEARAEAAAADCAKLKRALKASKAKVERERKGKCDKEALAERVEELEKQLHALCQFTLPTTSPADDDVESNFEPVHDPQLAYVGYAMKRQEHMKTWRRRLFAVQRDGTLTWWTRGESPKPRGCISIVSAQFRVLHQQVHSHNIDIVSPQRANPIQLMFSSQESMNAWLQHFHKIIADINDRGMPSSSM
jgi:PH domain